MGRRKRAVIFGASVGAGHSAVAMAYATRLRAAGYVADVHDYVAAAPFLARLVLRHWYVPQVQRAPDNFTWMVDMLQRPTWVWLIVRGTAVLSCPAILRGLVAPSPPQVFDCDDDNDDDDDDDDDDDTGGNGNGGSGGIDLVVSTYPLASQALGFLRARGWLDAPVISHTCDPGLHLLWFHQSVDLHAGSLPESMARATSLGYDCETVGLTVRPELLRQFTPEERSAIRTRLGLGAEDVAVVLTAGSLGLGNVVESVKAVLMHPTARAIVLCGHNDELESRLAHFERVISLGWQKNVNEVYAAGDVLVHNASYMSEEARAAGIPIITYLPLPGHGLLNAAAYERAGISEWPRSPEELSAAIDRAAARGRGTVDNTPGQDKPKDYVHVALDLAAKHKGNRGVTVTNMQIRLLDLACCLSAVIFYIVTAPGWVPVLTYIRLPQLSACVFYLRSAIAMLSLGISITIGLVVALFWAVVDPRRRPLGMVVASRIFMFLNRVLLGATVDVSGATPPDGPAVYVVNHQSELDLLVIGALFASHLTNGVVLAKHPLRNVPLLGWFMRATECGWVGRDRGSAARGRHVSSTHKRRTSDGGESLRGPAYSGLAGTTAVEAATHQVRRGRSVFVFPEGTRSRFEAPALLPFRTGAFVVAAETCVPVVPVVVKNYSHLYDYRARRWRSGVLEVQMLPPRRVPIDGSMKGSASEMTRDVAEEVRTEMLAALRES